MSAAVDCVTMESLLCLWADFSLPCEPLVRVASQISTEPLLRFTYLLAARVGNKDTFLTWHTLEEE